jgi:hypothetical protein
MSIWKLKEESPVIGQAISYTDRDMANQSNQSNPGVETQLELPFPPPVQTEKKPKTLRELEKEYDELFINFLVVLNGPDVSLENKQQVLKSLMNNIKGANSYVASRSQSLLLDFFSSKL